MAPVNGRDNQTAGGATAAATAPRGSAPRFFVPEVVQTSATDCGPATLKALLDGYGIPVSYERLREACQTSLDGSSIDTVEDVAVALGLNAQQLLVPVEHALLAEAAALPGIVTSRVYAMCRCWVLG